MNISSYPLLHNVTGNQELNQPEKRKKKEDEYLA